MEGGFMWRRILTACGVIAVIAIAYGGSRPASSAKAASINEAALSPCLIVFGCDGTVLNGRIEEPNGRTPYSAKELRDAYGIPSKGGAGQTVAVVLPGDDPTAEKDLAAYRSANGLPPCGAPTCFRKVDENGGTNYPTSTDPDVIRKFTIEGSLDIEMVSAACGECHILLVETADNINADIHGDVEAKALGATEISNSWGFEEQGGSAGVMAGYDAQLEALGVPITAAGGDYGYKNHLAGGSAAQYPATSPAVIAVGGTTLEKAPSTPRKWKDIVWNEGSYATESGCSLDEPKPAWQKDACTHRMANDVAIAAENVSAYIEGSWQTVGGTSAGAPLIAGLIALGGKQVRTGTSGAVKAFYEDLNKGIGSIWDVPKGSGNNGSCGPAEFECTAMSGKDGHPGEGYDGPTGVGVPQGPPTLAKWIKKIVSVSDGYLVAVSCSSSTSCIAVGEGSGKTLAEKWNGEAWSTQQTPNQSEASSYLSSVSCPESSACVAAGGYAPSVGEGPQSLVERWNGATWALEDPPQGEFTTANFDGISCTQSNACTAVGRGRKGAGPLMPFVERWNGSAWTTQSLPLPSEANGGGLHSVQCVSLTLCFAAGYYTKSTSSAQSALVEKWDGAKWERVNTPSIIGYSPLQSISCPQENVCVAVGEHEEEAFSETWDGSSWTLHEPPTPATEYAALDEVSCGRPTSCVAVGSRNYTASQAIIDDWNGTSWGLQENPEGLGTAQLYGVSCIGVEPCVAVGSYLVEGHWKPLGLVFAEECVGGGSGCEATSSGPPSKPEPGVADSTANNPGAPGLQPQVRGDTVNSASGNETTAQTDLVVGGRGPGLNVRRSYNAQASATAQAESKAAGIWGWGWTGPYGAHLVFGTAETGQETATVDQQNGSAIVFYKKEGGGYEQGGWVQARLSKGGSNYIYTLPDQTKLEFDGEGKLLKEIDRNGNATTVTYNSSKQIEKVTDSSGRTLTFNYNGEGLVESIKDPLGHLISYTYVAKGGLSTVAIEGKVRWEFGYTATAPYLLKSVTDGRKNSITREYDSSNRVIKETIGGHERKWSYGTNHTTITEPNGAVTVSTFNTANEPIEVVEAASTSLERITNCEYDGSTYNLTQLIDPNKHVTKYGYDGDGNRILEIDPSSDEHKWEYDTTHDVVKETTPGGEVTTTTVTKAGNPEVVARPVGSETQQTKYTYDAYGDVAEVTDPLGGHTKYTYDAYGDKEMETDPEGNIRKWIYDKDSQVVEEVSPRGYVTKFERNAYGLPTTVVDPLGHATEFKYDGNQNIVLETDGAKHTTEYEYNAEDLPTTIIKPNGDTINIGYDAEGEETSFTDGNGKTWEAKRNLLEQVSEEKNPLGKIWTKTYEPAGNLETREDPEGNATEYLYDASNRLEKVRYAGSLPEGWESPNVTYEYNKDGKVTKMKDETASLVNTTEYTWDQLDRLTKYTNDEGETLHYEYDLANLPTKITYPNGKSVTREYDKDKRLIKVTDWQGRAFSFNYDADSKLTATIFPSSSKNKDEYAYSKTDQMTEVNMLWGLISYAKLSYERDGDDQVTKLTERLNMSFAKQEALRLSVLDGNHRLVEENKHAYAYDKANNPTTIEGEAGYSYNEADQLKEGPTAKYIYNDSGQRTELIPKNGEHATTYEYNRAGLPLLIYRQSGPKQAEIEDWLYYDGSGLLLSERGERGSRGFVWNAAESSPVLLSENVYVSGERDYVYGPENLPLEEIFGSTTRYLHHDQQGSTRALTSGSEGAPTKWTVYGPYGRIIETKGTGTSSSLGYDGQFTNPETSLISVGARNYDPSTAQFIAVGPAPVLESTGEPYVFSQDNPENVRKNPIGGVGYMAGLGMAPGQP